MSSKYSTGRKDGRIGSWLRRIINGSHTQNEKCELIPFSEKEIECPVCLSPAEDPLQLSSCGHCACAACWRNFISSQIESFALAHLTCVACSELLQPSTIIHLLSAVSNRHESSEDSLKENQYARSLSRYEEFLLRKALSREPEARWCPRGCGYGLIAYSFQACPRIVCPHPLCEGRSFCYKCRRPWTSGDTSESSSDQNNVTHVCPSEQDLRSNALDNLRAFFGIRHLNSQMPGLNTIPNGSQQKISEMSVSPSTATKEKRYRVSKTLRSSTDYTKGARLSMEELVGDTDSGNVGTNTPNLEEKHSSSDSDVTNSFESSKTERRASVELNEPGSAVKPCPNCKTLIQKLNDGSCNSMVCSICNYEFCWLCLRETTATHYLNFSGCTVLGRSQWSKLRRVVTVCGIMLSTPILLPLAIVLALPAISVWFTFSMARQANRVLQSKSKHLRRFVVFWVVVAGLILYPVLTAFTFSLLIPILLGYVYLYLPISLLCSLLRHENGVQLEPTELERLQSVSPILVKEFGTKNADIKLTDENHNESETVVVVNETVSMD
uniref:RBR-type E3 ubiquitin transferase n=1 Tax=Trichobilharzia regenti TaxID=157069 RepID=A0AA85JP13_TRIRE|nr:unnamed protein product [Trichobilharzia regenti]